MVLRAGLLLENCVFLLWVPVLSFIISIYCVIVCCMVGRLGAD